MAVRYVCPVCTKQVADPNERGRSWCYECFHWCEPMQVNEVLYVFDPNQGTLFQ